MLYTVLIVFGFYIWLSWTDPDQVAMRQRAWDAAMEKIRGKQVVYASRYVNANTISYFGDTTGG
jgi:hypothetical protein